MSFTGHLSFYLRIWDCGSHLIEEKVDNVFQVMLASYKMHLASSAYWKKKKIKTKPKPKPNKNSSNPPRPETDTKLRRFLAIFHLKLGETADFRRQAECSNRWNKSESEVFGCRQITRACFVGRNGGITNMLYHKRLLICGLFFCFFFLYSYNN